MAAPSWLTARPIAHRGLHDQSLGLIENTLSAARAAMAGDFAIECDVQLSADGEAMVFHDATLDRLTQSSGLLAAHRAEDLAQVALKGTTDRIPTLASLLALLAGRVPLICEIKSAFDGDLRLTRRTLDVVRAAGGPVALKSFDPAIVAALRDLAPDLPRGIVGESRFDDPEWEMLGERRKELAQLLHYPLTRPDFLSWRVLDLETAPPVLARHGLGLPVLAWTVRSAPDRALAQAGADQMIFEGFVPN